MEALGVIDNEGRQSEEKLNRSRFNALKHGLTARTAVLPGEDPELFQAVVDVYKARLKTQNEVEDDLAENAALAKWQMTRATAAQRARVSHELLTRKNANSLRDAVAAVEIRNRLFHDRQGPIELYPSKCEYFKGLRTSCSGEPDDPLDPTVLILQAESTVAGCQMLRREWEALRRNLLSGLSIQSHEKLKLLRLMGKQPMQAMGDPEVAQVFLACHALEARYGYAFHELRSEIEEERFKSQKAELKRWDDQGITPADVTAAKAVLLSKMDAAIERLRLLERERQELVEQLARDEKEMLRHDESKGGEQIRRHIGSCSRLMIQNVETIRKRHRDEERGWGRTRAERARRQEERAVVEDGRGSAGNQEECWPGYEAEARELRLKREAEVDALNAARVPDYARWKPSVGEDLTQRGGDAGRHEGGDSAGTGERGVTPLMGEQQGEGANIQNEILEITQSRQDAKGGRGEGMDSETKGEGEFVTLMVQEQGEGGNVQNEIEEEDAKEDTRESGTMGGCGVMPLMIIEEQGERVNTQNEMGQGVLGRIDESGARSGERPMERLATREKRRRRQAKRKRALAGGDARDGVLGVEQATLDSIKWLLPNSVAMLRDYYGSRAPGDGRGSERGKSQ